MKKILQFFRTNVFLKSALRQPLCSLLLALLLAAATFAFVVRVVEFIAVNDKIAEISRFYRPVGLLQGGGADADVTDIAAIVADSGFDLVEDRRRGFEGTLVGLQNAYTFGSFEWWIDYNAQTAGETLHDLFWWRDLTHQEWSWYGQLLDYNASAIIDNPDFTGFQNTDIFIYAEVIDIWQVDEPPLFFGWNAENLPWHQLWHWPFDFGFRPHINILVQIDETVAGYPEHVRPGGVNLLRHELTPETAHAFDNIEVGERYFFGATFHYMTDGVHVLNRHRTRLTLLLNSLGDDGLWYASSSNDIPGLENDLHRLNRAQSSVYLRTTRDMTTMPIFQEDLETMRMRSGRRLTEDDFANANPVAVIDHHFATTRRLAIGDTITINVNREQYLMLSPYRMTMGVATREIGGRPPVELWDLGVLSRYDTVDVYELELEIVGTFTLFDTLPRIDTSGRAVSKMIFVPDSLLPADMGLVNAPDLLPAAWYSFALSDSRDEDFFMMQYWETFGLMGFELDFISTNADAFWNLADFTRLTTMINLILFSVVLLAVLAFIAFIFLRQRRKDAAIMRALGASANITTGRATSSVLIFGALPIFLGTVAAWQFAGNLITSALYPFAELLWEVVGGSTTLRGGENPISQRDELIAGYLEAMMPPIALPMGLSALILLLLVGLVAAGIAKNTRQPVLEILQKVGR